MYATNEFRKGLRIEIEKVPYQIVEFQHVSPGKGSAFTRTKLKNLLNLNVIERTFKSGDKVDEANTEFREMQYLYKDAEGYHFMDQASYEQLVMDDDTLGESAGYLQENTVVQVLLYNDRPITVDLPTFVVLQIAETDPAFRGDTVTGSGKPAKLSTGASIQVPYHVVEGDLVKVDTRDGSYVEKANK